MLMQYNTDEVHKVRFNSFNKNFGINKLLSSKNESAVSHTRGSISASSDIAGNFVGPSQKYMFCILM